jgi:dTDP-4-dehydrorhamnose reductase
MKILVFGRTGQVARGLASRAQGVTLAMHDRQSADFTDPETCAALVAATDADAVINAVAHVAADRAEEEEDLARRINAETPGAIAGVAAARGLPMVHISTEYVFDGTGTQPWPVDAAPVPLSAYGRTKLGGEQAVREAGGPHAIVRTSWVVSPHGRNFVTTMMGLGAERAELRVVADQVGGPTPAADLAGACLEIAAQLVEAPDKTGIYHYAGAPDVTRADFAREIFARAGLPCTVRDIATKDYPTPAQRPLNSRLDCSQTEAVFGLARPDWRAGLDAILAEFAAMRRE